jgi:hypothetical protein
MDIYVYIGYILLFLERHFTAEHSIQDTSSTPEIYFLAIH